jgi:stalled ribosome rescue protein Dom34
VIVFVAVSAVIVAILFLHLIATPFIKEKLFMHRVNKATPGQGIVLLYRRIQRKYTKASMGEVGTYTPYEYAYEFERIYGLNVDELSLLVEKAAYMQEEVTEADKKKAVEIYLVVKEFLKQRKNQKIKK